MLGAHGVLSYWRDVPGVSTGSGVGAGLSADFDPVVQRPCHQGVLGRLFLPPICHITHIPGCTARLISMPSHPSSVPQRRQGLKGAAVTHNSLVQG